MSDEIDIRLRRICAKLQDVQRAQPSGFGRESHRYLLAPPIREADIARFEQAHGVVLPIDFRRFLSELGSGGAGPAYGLSSFRDLMNWLPPEAGSPLAMPCPIRIPSGDIWPPEPQCGGDWGAMEKGTIEIVSEGCTFVVLLVVTGELRGRVVRGNLDDDGRAYVTGDRDFLAWYERWLDHLLWGWRADEAGLGRPGTEAELAQCLRDPATSIYDRCDALLALNRMPEFEAATKAAVREQLVHADANVLVGALDFVLWCDWLAGASMVEPLLRHPAPKVRELAIRVLGKARHPGWQSLVGSLLTDVDEEVAACAVKMLESGRPLRRRSERGSAGIAARWLRPFARAFGRMFRP